MNSQTSDPRFALGQSIGLSAFIWGYPLVESMRTCRLQTTAEDRGADARQSPIDRLQPSRDATTAQERDIG
ncbi:MAG: hypothetical protein R3E68_02875 [Burkholderiaceae bacterium]